MKKGESRKYGVPALLSFFVPSLGQFVKGDWKFGFAIWIWFILGNLLVIILASIFSRLLAFFLVIIFSLILWVYQIYDAYNSPVEH